MAQQCPERKMKKETAEYESDSFSSGQGEQMGEDGFSQEQQDYIRSLILTYRKRFSALEITAVWDFGMEEGTRYENDKYGVFEKCRDLAVSNRDMASISYNHIRVSRMPMDISGQKLEDILKAYEAVRHISAMAGEIRLEMMASGMPPGRISEVINEKAAAYLKEEGLCLGSEEDPGTIAAGPHNSRDDRSRSPQFPGFGR